MSFNLSHTDIVKKNFRSRLGLLLAYSMHVEGVWSIHDTRIGLGWLVTKEQLNEG